jgi:hypothetical protein
MRFAIAPGARLAVHTAKAYRATLLQGAATL